MSTKDVSIPDIGDFDEVPVIEIHVAAGDQVEEEQPLVTLESDKATMEVPAPFSGTIKDLLVAVGDKVKKGVVIARMEPSSAESSSSEAPRPPRMVSDPSTNPSSVAHANSAPAVEVNGATQKGDIHADVAVLGAGPGGYTAAFRAADLGLKTVLIERSPRLGGVCLNVGCIPSKALLHAAKVITEAEESVEFGLKFGPPEIDLDSLRGWKDKVVQRLTGGLTGLAKSRNVQVVHGVGSFSSSHLLTVTHDNGKSTTVSFDSAIIAAGSEPVALPFFPVDERVIDSTGALELRDVPKRLLIVGGGIIGLEMGCVYDALGSEVTIVELMDGLMPGADRDLVRPLQKRLQKRLKGIKLKTKVTACEAKSSGLVITFENTKGEQTKETFDRVLVAVGRKPNGRLIGLDLTGVRVDERGFVPVDRQMRTNIAHIFAIGDIVGQPMLAHKATHEGKTAAEVIAGQPSYFDARVIPSVAYTDPEVAWTGLTETEAKEQGVAYEKGSFPWAASGRSLAMGRDEGLTKVLFDPQTHRVLGGGIVGSQAGDLIAELCLAVEMGADAADIGLTIHPHPTLSESVALSAEAFEGTITDLYIPKKEKPKPRREI